MAESVTNEQIAQAATGPKSASVDGQSVTARNADEIIKLDQYLESKKAGRKTTLPMRMGKIRPGGPTD